MAEHAVGSFFLFVLILLASSHILGDLFARLHQPRVIGEILAGVLVGPSLLKVSAGFAGAPAGAEKAALDIIYWLGLLFLMFLSGAETKGLFSREDRKEVGWLAVVGTGLPFAIALALGSRLSLDSMMGTVQRRVFRRWQREFGRLPLPHGPRCRPCLQSRSFEAAGTRQRSARIEPEPRNAIRRC